MDSTEQGDDFVFVVSVSKNRARFYEGACPDTGAVRTCERWRAVATAFRTLEEAVDACRYCRAWGYPHAQVFKVHTGAR